MSNMVQASTARGPDSGPSRLWYLLAVAVFFAGMAGMGTILSRGIADLHDDLVQVVVPGETELTLDAGGYTIFHESRSVVGGRIFGVEDIAGLGVTLRSAAGEEVVLEPVSTSGGYEFAGRSGTSAFTFEIGDPGMYRLSAAYREGAAGPETVLAVGKGFGGNLLVTVLGSMAIAFAGVGLALVIGTKVFFGRRAARRAVDDREDRAVIR